MHKGVFILSTILLAPLNGYAAEKFVHGTDMGTTPVLAAPSSSLVPTVNIANAKGWPEGKKPKAAPGFEVTAFADGLDHPRWVYVLPNGDVLVAESNKPAKPNKGPSIKGFFEKQIMKKAGAGTQSANRITLLRNPVGMDWEPQTNVLWAAVNERDELGDNLVPDYMTSVKDGGFYGWPYSYFGQHVDERVKPQQPDLVAKAIKPDYALGSHTASLGLEFYDAKLFPAKYHGGVFIGQHGSWNRSEPAGYKVIFIPFKNGKPNGKPEDILTGFREGKTAYGRPVGVAVDKRGALLVADDVGNVIWRVTPVKK